MFERTAWRCGVTIGLTPLGARALLGVPAPDLVGHTVPLADLPDGHDAELAGRLAAAPDWPTRFDLLDDLLHGWLARDVTVDPLITHAWWRLQRDAGTHRVGASRTAATARRRRNWLRPSRVRKPCRPIKPISPSSPSSRAPTPAGQNIRATGGLLV